MMRSTAVELTSSGACHSDQFDNNYYRGILIRSYMLEGEKKADNDSRSPVHPTGHTLGLY